jgi:hypothetical protein
MLLKQLRWLPLALCFYTLQGLASDFKCKVNFDENTYLIALEKVSKNSVRSEIDIVGIGNEYRMKYGNGEYFFPKTAITVRDGFLVLSNYEVFGNQQILTWVVEIPTQAGFGIIYGESPWAVLACRSL